MATRLADRLCTYALFLEQVMGRRDLAEVYYRRALMVDPNHVRTLGQYAVFRESCLQDYDGAEQLYQRAIALRPADPDVLGNYAEFRHTARRDLDGAESAYRAAIDADPVHANNLTNFATFLTEVRGEHEEAETLYRRAVAADPNDHRPLARYAIYLTDVRAAYAEAQALYRQAHDLAPDNPAVMVNLAGVLLLQGSREEGLAWVEMALAHPAVLESPADEAEGWFYLLLYGPADDHERALVYLQALAQDGVTTPGWNFGPHLRAAEALKPQHAALLPKLAACLTGEMPWGKLGEWPASGLT